MKLAMAILLSSVSIAQAELPAKFVRAIHLVETSGRTGYILGDNGKALGPLQIHKAYWQDSGVPGNYLQCTNLAYSTKVMTAYLTRYCPNAVKSNNFEIMARVHNGGLGMSPATIKYWNKVKKELTIPK